MRIKKADLDFKMIREKKLRGLILTGFLLFGICACEKNLTEEKQQDIWEYSTPAEQQMNSAILDSAFIQAESASFIDGLLVIRNGYIVAENYYNGYSKSKPHNVMSVSKSFLSATVGIAFQLGYLDSLEEKVMDYFPEYVYLNMDSRKYDITIRHLLTMRMGIIDESENNYGAYWQFYNSNNWIKTTIEAPLIFNPGEKMRYNTFQTHLLSAIITKATQQSTRKFMTKYLCEPLGIDIGEWERDPQGYYFGGNSMHFTPQEMAMLGFLYLNKGKIDNVQIVSEDWVDLTLTASTNIAVPSVWGALKNYNYAWLWWLGQINDHDLFMAYGYGGQFVIVFPDLELIVVSTATNNVDPDMSTVQEWTIFDIISQYILPSITS